MFVDLHTHFLPGVDDGPSTLAETVELLAAAHATGTRTLVATPHMFAPALGNDDAVRVRRHFDDCIGALERLAGKPEYAFLAELDLRLGGENLLSPELLEAVPGGGALTLAGSRYLLVEFSHFLPAATAVSGLERLRAEGLVPVISHVERYPQLVRRGLDRALEMGCIAQLNAASVAGHGGRRLRKECLKLLKTGRAQLIASDAHGAAERPPDLLGAHDLLRKKLPPEQVSRWLREYPAMILEDLPLSQLSRQAADA